MGTDQELDEPPWTGVTVTSCVAIAALAVLYAVATGDVDVILPAIFAGIWGGWAMFMRRTRPVAVPLSMGAAAFGLFVVVGDAVTRLS